jgi:hypothetical protein
MYLKQNKAIRVNKETLIREWEKAFNRKEKQQQ